MKPDAHLKPYATERQWEYILAVAEHGSARKAARALGVAQSVLSRSIQGAKKRAAQQGWAPEYGLTHEVPDGLTLRGTSIRYNGDGKVEQYWNKSRVQGREPDETVQIPDPKKIVKRSTLYDQTGRVTQQWISEKPEDAARETLWREFATQLATGLPRIDPTPVPPQGNDSLMACYPVGDHHMGMLSWDKETGNDYDLKIGEQLLVSATDHLVNLAPPCERAVVVFLGDYLHYDSFDTVTPTSRNQLDADGRFPKMVRVAIRSMRYLIETAAKRHGHVQVIVEIGNHDLSSSIFLMECLNNIYENDPRISIDTSPMHYHYFDFGQNLVGTHHGHGAKLQDLPLIMATDRPEAWGRTKHRYIWSGHVHHDQAKDVQGCRVESFRILAPADAWAAQKGYRAKRDMKSIILHKEFGVVARHTVSPDMMQ